jgi:imidazoleglycerol-phosphate dehydratase
MSRTGLVERFARDTKILIEIEVDGSGTTDVETGIGFYDDMLNQLGTHAGFDLTVHAVGDARAYPHPTVVGTAAALGEALRQALGDAVGTQRFGQALIPLDDCLVEGVVDVAGRPFVVHEQPPGLGTILLDPVLPVSLVHLVWQGLAHHASLALHLRTKAGSDPYLLVEGEFRAVGRALRAAVALEPRTYHSHAAPALL